MGKYEGRLAIITGASGGLGSAMALRLAQGGMALRLVGRTAADLEKVAEEARAAGSPDARPVPLDIQQEGALADLVEQVGRDNPYLFALINNAGVMHLETIMTGRRDRWRAMFDINVLAPIEGCRAAIEVMRGHGRPGHLINVGSLAARITAGGVYGASKLAQEMISRTLRAELEFDDIRVTSIIPGGFVSKLARDLEPHTVELLMENARKKGIDFASADNSRFLGDPVHVASAVEFVLDQPIHINIQEMIVQPPVAVEF